MDTNRNFLIADDYHYMREMSELLTLVAKSYEALNIGQINNMIELKFAIEHVEAIKKHALEVKSPEDIESLGLAASFFNHEEIETFERVVAFFHKKKPVYDVPWNRFIIQNGHILISKVMEDTKSKQ